MGIVEKALLVGLVLGGLFAIYVARRSLQEEKVYGGILSKLFHFLGVMFFCMTLPTVITVLILHGGFGVAFPLGLGLVATSFVALAVFAIFEKPARDKLKTEEEDVWTEAKARASGM